MYDENPASIAMRNGEVGHNANVNSGSDRPVRNRSATTGKKIPKAAAKIDVRFREGSFII